MKRLPGDVAGIEFVVQCFGNSKAETPPSDHRGGALLGCKSLTMTYFHTGTRTIIGAKSFHCPVRDGKEWYQLAMVIRHN